MSFSTYTNGNTQRVQQYLGTDGQAIVEQFGVFVSESAGVLTYHDDGFPTPEFTAESGQYIVWYSEHAEGSCGMPLDELPAFPASQIVTPAELPEPVAPPTLAVREGKGSLVAKALGGAQDVTVTLDEPMGSSSWKPTSVAILGAPGLAGLGGHGITGWTVVDEETITVHVQSAIGALAATDVVYVSAVDLV